MEFGFYGRRDEEGESCGAHSPSLDWQFADRDAAAAPAATSVVTGE